MNALQPQIEPNMTMTSQDFVASAKCAIDVGLNKLSLCASKVGEYVLRLLDYLSSLNPYSTIKDLRQQAELRSKELNESQGLVQELTQQISSINEVNSHLRGRVHSLEEDNERISRQYALLAPIHAELQTEVVYLREENLVQADEIRHLLEEYQAQERQINELSKAGKR